ncbi:porin [Pseudorhodoplanes sp.]|uniref:porin n=1 Tax=Pseudorhodoplanes sp. TaxID=1934341 RepID=UPI00391AD0C0
MNVLKTMLAASAAALLVTGTAHSADLPVKAKAVEYVKICSLYGTGYYYIPGTDTCIKIGGYVRYEAYHNAPQGSYPNNNATGAFTRTANTFAQQSRFRLTGDVRTQTEYGTLRAYFAFGFNVRNGINENTPPSVSVAMERAFIQFAGFTIGRAETFFTLLSISSYGFMTNTFDAGTTSTGMNLLAYTWQLGNGLSASLSLEDSAGHNKGIVNLGNAAAAGNTAGVLGAAPFASSNTSSARGVTVPDIVGNIRVDQAWGSAQIMGALHQNAATYYFNDNTPNCNGGGNRTTMCGHPDEKWGWAVGAGLTLKMPWDSKDTLSGQIAYAKGASSYVAFANSNNGLHMSGGIALGAFNDAVYGGVGLAGNGVSALELTETWGGTVAFEHYWTPSLRTAWTFGYMSVQYSDAAKTLIANLGQRCIGTSITINDTSKCDPDFSSWRVSSRTMWTPVRNLDIGAEIAYTQVDTAFKGAVGTLTASNNGLAAGNYVLEDQGVWSAAVRVQRSFWP